MRAQAIIREAYYELKIGIATSLPTIHNGHTHVADRTNSTAQNTHHDHQDMEHLDHCFDYLRQAIMCAADPAVEPAAIETEGPRRTVDGWGAEHLCRNWDELVDFAVENRAYDKDGILNSGEGSDG
jgi:hypothetical protein